jgi:hypothetical protein
MTRPNRTTTTKFVGLFVILDSPVSLPIYDDNAAACVDLGDQNSVFWKASISVGMMG